MINHRNDCVQSFVYIFFDSFMGKKANHFKRHLTNGLKDCWKNWINSKVNGSIGCEKWLKNENIFNFTFNCILVAHNMHILSNEAVNVLDQSHLLHVATTIWRILIFVAFQLRSCEFDTRTLFSRNSYKLCIFIICWEKNVVSIEIGDHQKWPNGYRNFDLSPLIQFNYCVVFGAWRNAANF